ncbi:oxidoreductase [Sphingobium lactosutens]|uniref:Gfo/Idh/MocA family protein n=1 Tax=Sphingobium lactosutens TaxID=522773 RepID=UPI0015B982F2|nr:Gfo/Idh/MocA family oxidoreductase [Sphingobium lactosutens]NWK98332.1 oxidoreductase [Sphingobium lactosutens]
MKVGIVGVTPGRSWATISHIPALQGLPGYDIAGLANSSEASSRAAGEACGLKAYPDVQALLQDEAVDLVAVTVKVPNHRALVDAALDAGKMVYCEWPLGNGLADAEAMAAHAAERDLRTVIGLQARFSPVIRYVRDLVRDGYVGEVLSTTLVGSGMSWGAQVNAPHAYTHDRKNGATLLTIPLGHTIDAVCFCLGEFREVSATMATRRESYEIVETGATEPMLAEDQVAFNGLLENGAVASVHYRGGVSRGTNLLWEINGTKGDLQITSYAGHAQMFELTLRGGQGDSATLEEMVVPESYRTIPPGIEGFAVNVGELYARFEKGDDGADPAPDFAAAVKRHGLLDAIERSAQNGQRISL